MPSHLPIRRLGSWNLPVRRRQQLGDWQTSVIDLNASQVTAFLARHPDVQSKVSQFENLVARFGYYQGKPGYPIPEWGIAVADSDYTNVFIFPDASGQLRYTGNIPNDVATEINLPPYVSPAGDGAIPWTALLWIAGGLLAVSVVNTVRGR
jgi:hypothetical protein